MNPIPLPLGLAPLHWAAVVHGQFPTQAPILQRESDWREWANTLIAVPPFSTYNAPDPNDYSSLMDWATVLFRTYPGEVN